MSSTRSPVSLREPRERVSPRAPLMWAISGALQGLLAVALIGGAWRLTDFIDLRWWYVALAVAAVALHTAIVPRWRYLVHRWEITETAVYTQTGWWTRERRIAPMSRIQTVDYSEGPVSRLFGLATLTVTTASAAGALQVAGLDNERAQALAEQLTAQADAVQGDAT